MDELTSGQRKTLRSAAHHFDPVVYIGKKGITDEVIQSADQALAARELIKVKFNEFKEEKRGLTDSLAQSTSSQVAGIIGNVSILYRPHEDVEKRQYESQL